MWTKAFPDARAGIDAVHPLVLSGLAGGVSGADPPPCLATLAAAPPLPPPSAQHNWMIIYPQISLQSDLSNHPFLSHLTYNFFRCPLLHRTAGDTERRYHLRYYKTGMCVHDTDNRGYCVKNGPHCAFAHGANDLRPPVYDSRYALDG